jgi:hypothetical protein
MVTANPVFIGIAIDVACYGEWDDFAPESCTREAPRFQCHRFGAKSLNYARRTNWLTDGAGDNDVGSGGLCCPFCRRLHHDAQVSTEDSIERKWRLQPGKIGWHRIFHC